MQVLCIVYNDIQDPPEEDNALIRAVFPEATLSHPGVFYLEGDFDAVAARMGTIEGWTLAREGRFTLS